MPTTPTSLDQLKEFLNKIFQFDTQDLDFGVYKILHYKKKEIKDFIENLLVNKVKEQLHTFSTEESAQLREQLAELEKEDLIKGWLEADEAEKKTLEKYGKDKINQYRALKGQVTEANVSVETENQIYNHLTLFFSRYYDKGDFISKRRFGKNEKYMVPYNGEETHFHWANHDQYYIKSSETFQQYAFKVPTTEGTLVVNFKLHDAQLEQGNVKAEETNYFVLRPNATHLTDDDATFFFDYRPLDEAEKARVKGNSKQDALDEEAFEALKKDFGKNPLLAGLWREEVGQPLLLKKLHHYTRKNKHDFFIHKNLKGFLERELDFYIKSELISVDDLYVTDSDAHFDRLKYRLKTIKVFKSIADTIIAFVTQIEDFQKKLWEKKKFVLSTEWVITLDRLVEYLGEAAARPVLEEVLTNAAQVAEWKGLFGGMNIPKALSLDTLKFDLHSWRKLPIDTVHFSNEFKSNLLNFLSEKVNLEEKADGLVIHSDNYHGLNVIHDKYYELIKAIYIDPPYNTSATEILYKNSFKHSSWLSFIENRLSISKNLLKKDGIICITIDDYELQGLSFILESTFGDNHLATVPIRNNPSGRSTVQGFSINHEYGLFYAKDIEKVSVGRLPHDDDQTKRYAEEDSNGNKFEWENFRKSSTDSDRADRPKQHFPIFINEKTSELRVPSMTWESSTNSWNIEDSLEDGEIMVFPNQKSVEKVWSFGIERTSEEIKNLKYVVRKGKYEIYKKKFINDEGTLPRTWWDKSKYSARDNGTREIVNLFGRSVTFDFPKSPFAVIDSLKVCAVNDTSFILDYFPGSGTTFHATQCLNREDEGRRKCILTEQGNHFYSLILPRIKKIAYTFDWKDGLPKDGSMNGLGIFMKYQRLEQYEEALENIAFTAPEAATQPALAFEQYIPKYFLEFETRGSQSLVNTAAMRDPWNYRLKVWDGFTYDTERAVDLVETFNYLIGLHLQKQLTKELNGRRYQFIVGHNNASKQIVVVWRSTQDWTLDDFRADAEALKQELTALLPYDLLYLNDQAHLDGYQPIEEIFKNKMLP